MGTDDYPFTKGVKKLQKEQFCFWDILVRKKNYLWGKDFPKIFFYNFILAMI